MAISERDHRALHARLVERIGEREADVLMDLLPPVGWAEVATRSDLAQLEARLDLKLEAFESRLSVAFHRDLIRQTWIFVGTVIAAMGAIAGLLGAS